MTYRKIENTRQEIVEKASEKKEETLEVYTSLLASSLEDMKKEIRAEFDEEICKKIDSKLSCLQSSSTPRLIESTRVKRPGRIFGECTKRSYPTYGKPRHEV
jgi:hypothetical protein